MYEIRKAHEGSTVETAATLDHARDRARKLSTQTSDWLVVTLVDRHERIVRSLAMSGRVVWTVPCKECNGTGKGAYGYACGGCFGVGHVEDRNA